MSRVSRTLVAAFVTTFFVVLLVPETILWTIRAVRSGGADVWRSATTSIPRPVLIVLLMIVFLLVSFAIIFGIVRLFTSYGTSTGEQVAGWYERVTPDTPQTKALVFMVGFVVVFIVGIAVFAPTLAASLANDTGAGDFVDDLEDGNYAGEIQFLFENDGVPAANGTVSLRRTNGSGVVSDIDGDGIPDDWERSNQAPNGAGLPGSSTRRMDLYVQIDTGSEVPELSSRERSALRNIWNGMPVQNPDGSTGIDLHIVETDIDGEISAEQPDQYYTESNLGLRHCLYRQVVLGQIDTTQGIGAAETPGYASVYDGSRYTGYDGEVPFRSAMITHALLHQITGEVDGSVHSDGGWLDYPSEGNERLSDSVAAHLEDGGFRTTTSYLDRCHGS